MSAHECSHYTTFLFSSPSPWRAFGSVVDLMGTGARYNQSRDGVTADLRALRADGLAVCADGQAALHALVNEAK